MDGAAPNVLRARGIPSQKIRFGDGGSWKNVTFSGTPGGPCCFFYRSWVVKLGRCSPTCYMSLGAPGYFPQGCGHGCVDPGPMKASNQPAKLHESWWILRGNPWEMAQDMWVWDLLYIVILRIVPTIGVERCNQTWLWNYRPRERQCQREHPYVIKLLIRLTIYKWYAMPALIAIYIYI